MATQSNILKITNRINKMRKGYIFTSSDFYDIVKDPSIVSRTLKGLVESGTIRKVGKGKFDKPKQTVLGELPPSVDWMLQSFLTDNKRAIGYITGLAAFAQMGLTSQISSSYTIGSNVYRRAIICGGYIVRFVLQPNTITRANIPLLQILDAIRFIKQIPDCTPDEAYIILRSRISKLTTEERKQLASLSLAYASYVRAITGAILDEVGEDTTPLFNSLNPASSYKIGISSKTLSNKKKWNLK